MLVKDAPSQLVRRKIEESLYDWIMDDENIPVDIESSEAVERFITAESRLEVLNDEQLIKAVLNNPSYTELSNMDIDDIGTLMWIDVLASLN